MVKEISQALSFSKKEMEAIIPFMLKHNPELETVDDFIKEWEKCWFRDYNFDKDIVDYEWQYISDYNHDTKAPINTKEELKNYLVENYVHNIEDEVNIHNWSIYKIHDKLWIEVNC